MQCCARGLVHARVCVLVYVSMVLVLACVPFTVKVCCWCAAATLVADLWWLKCRAPHLPLRLPAMPPLLGCADHVCRHCEIGSW